MRISNRIRNLVVAGCLLPALWLVYQGSSQHARQVNTDLTTYDQNGYLYYGRLMHDTQYVYVGDRNRMPAFPFLLSLFYQPGWSEEQFFAFGKSLNIFLSIAFLTVLYIILKKYLTLHAAVNLWLMTAFTVFVFKAAYVQAEIIFYFLNFILFLVLCRMFLKPDWKTAVAAGLLFGIGHLTKASVLPELLAFLLLFFLKTAIEIWQNRKRVPVVDFSWRRTMGQLLLVATCFTLIIFPYIHNSKKIFGQYFYNVNSTYYFWCESVAEWKNGPKAHGDRFGRPDMPDNQIPSVKNYLDKYGVRHMGYRLYRGAGTMFRACRDSYGFFKYFFLYFFFAGIIAALNIREAKALLFRHLFLILFIAGLFIGYGVLMAWWNYLGPQVRHILAFFLPFVFSAAYLIEKLPRHHIRISLHGMRINLVQVMNGALSLMLIFDIYLNLTVRIFTMPAGI
jgi:hypothetical protein